MNKNIKKITLVGAALFAMGANAGVMTYDSDDPNLPITFQGGPNTISSTFAIADSGIINDLNMSINVSVGFFSDLSGSLTSPDGTVVQLFSGLDGFSFDIDLDDEAANSFADVNDTFDVPDGFFNPFDALTPEGTLADFDGENILGDWTLTLTDSEDFFTDNDNDANTLFSWGITASVPEPSTLSLILFAGILLTVSARKNRK